MSIEALASDDFDPGESVNYVSHWIPFARTKILILFHDA